MRGTSPLPLPDFNILILGARNHEVRLDKCFRTKVGLSKALEKMVWSSVHVNVNEDGTKQILLDKL